MVEEKQVYKYSPCPVQSIEKTKKKGRMIEQRYIFMFHTINQLFFDSQNLKSHLLQVAFDYTATFKIFRIRFLFSMFPSSTSNHSETTNSQILMQSNDPKCPKGSLGKIIHLEKQTIGYLNDLYAVRLIEKLARPIQIEKKHQLINDVKNRLHVIHERMRKIGEELDTGFLTIQKQPKIGWKEKKIFQMNLHAKLAIFNLRKKYSEVLISSSFVHYKYITKNLQINEPLEMLDIQKWLYSCTQKLEKLSKNQTQSCC